VPFAALPHPAAGNYQPLIADHEVVNLPSASALALIRREAAGRQTGMKTLALLADPVFEADDPRFVTLRKKKASNSAPARREGFSRLPFSREEADEIAKLVPKNSLLKATDFRANRATATSPELSRYRIIHFATHGLLNDEHPLLSGLAFSLVDENGAPQDGYLRMHEIYNLRLPADLVVLSACQTALGEEIKGEGLVGLTRGFMHAGAQRVVASLWRVDDQATADLMKRFYRGMLKENLRPAAALRAAQIEMSKISRWSSPYFWASFVLQGEWR
jgi:CHAT domain-containing protein